MIHTHIVYRDLARENNNHLNRDELQSTIGELEAKKRVLKALTVAEPSVELKGKLAELINSRDDSNTQLTNYSSTTENLRQSCLASRIEAKAAGSTNEQTPECKEYEEAALSASTNIFGNSELFLCVADLDFQINHINETREALDKAIDELDKEINILQLKLATADAKFTSLAKHAADSQDQLDSQWLQFEFDSTKTTFSTSSSRKHFSTAASYKAGGFLWSARASFSYSKSESSFERKMNSADVNVKGELLRVTVQRPWFRPSLFKSKQFQIRVSLNLKPCCMEVCFTLGPTYEREREKERTASCFLHSYWECFWDM